MGFGGKWRAWIRNCLSHSKFAVLINSYPSGFFKSERGLWQGHSLSPLLYLIVGDVLSYMFTKAKDLGWVDGLEVKKGGLRVNHLQL